MLTDHQGNNFQPVAIKTSSIHSRQEGKQCIPSCMACQGEYREHSCGYNGDTSYLPISKWRSMTGKDFNQFTEWLGKLSTQRWNLGAERYHSDTLGFQGDPLDHAIEEWFDMGCYLFYTKRRYGGL